ncbi:Type cbb3 cytochrome oxidase biogenesis protein CcoG [Caenispirillum salinarum AK4]|uniref:Type cbb3 cytochrome oxidase biogenesis protein CcoG n=2 Tax=Caenispirillum TaxID=414051 RepID=K9GZ52_9PROT|nr:Type cbb3 cytochrome oxidase biogenesis protein CcoG [Caenispirillum salinarum AK4]
MAEASGALYAAREKIHPKAVRGRFRRWKDAIGWTLAAVFFIVPWLRWDRPGDLPDQAVLLDIANKRGFLFDMNIWPQDIVYMAVALVLGTVALFMTASVAGRVWCGFSCPQTVFTDIFVRIEKMWEGDRAARMKMDAAPWSTRKLLRRGGKHMTWIAVAAAFGATFSFYFTDAPAALMDYLTLDAGLWMWTTVLILGGTTYLLAGFAREQFCNYMCPWPRLQSCMLDEHSLVVTYRDDRGDARAAKRKSQTWEERRAAGFGDCVSCQQCVQVCPMGIDIREGVNADCINCGLCIDACDTMMDKVGLDRGLIAFDSLANARARRVGRAEPSRIVRPRTIAFAAVIGVICVGVLGTFLMRSDLEVALIQERSPLYVRLSDGSIRNAYDLKILNKREQDRRFALEVAGNPSARIETLDASGEGEGVELAVEGGRHVSRKVFVTVPGPDADVSDMTLVMRDTATGAEVRRDVVFALPR